MMKKINLKSIKKVILFIVLIALAIGLFFMIKYGIKLNNLRNEAIRMIDTMGSEVFVSNQVTTIYDADKNVICELSGAKKSYYLKDEEIPRAIKEAFLVSEDRSFYEHSGIDYKAVARAFIALVKNEGEITQGGSTITQQLARNIYLTHEVTMERKIKEMFIAMELEKKYSKDKILEFYINNIYYGNGYYGIGAAAKGYFSKDVKELTLAETAFICAIPNNPTKYDPYENLDQTIERKNRILNQMYDQGYIDGNAYNEALYETVTLQREETVKHNYIETYIRYCATRELMKERGFVFKNEFNSIEERELYDEEYEKEYSYCNQLLFVNGYEIYTSIDLEMQEKLQNSVDSVLSGNTQVNEEGIYKLQASSVCIDNFTGYVKAIVGGRSQEYDGYTLNRAYQSFRQPGSAIKPVLVYTPALERGYTPDSRVMDEDSEDGPDNYYNYFMGEVSLRRAVEISINTIPWKLLGEIGIGNGLAYLKKMNFSKIDTKDYVPAVSIGGMTYGVSSLEMAAAYSTIENDGIYRTPTCIVKIKDYNGSTIVDNGDNSVNEKHIYDMNASRMMTDIMKGVMINGTGRSYNLSNAICAGKTGTTNGDRDVWMVGYSTYYTTAVWCGYDMPQSLSVSGETRFAGNIWNKYMEELHDGRELVDFMPYIKLESEEQETMEEETEETEETESDDIESDETGTSETTGSGTYEEESTSYDNHEGEGGNMGSYEEESESSEE